jgi:hypothetical protein
VAARQRGTGRAEVLAARLRYAIGVLHSTGLLSHRLHSARLLD